MRGRLMVALRRWWMEGQHAHRRWWLGRERFQLSRAFTLRHARTGRQETYVVCLECGQELEYDLKTMRLTGRVIQRPLQAPDAVALERQWRDAAEATSCSDGSLGEPDERRAGRAAPSVAVRPASD